MRGGTGYVVEIMSVGCALAILFSMVLRVGISSAKFAPQVVKFCCYSVGVEDCVSVMQGDELECLLYYGDATFNHFFFLVVLMPHS